jgi:hypothetical protein
MRVGLLKPVQFPDELSNRFQSNVKDAVETLAADHDVVSAPVTALSVTTVIPAGRTIVVFTGLTGQKLTLPQAKAQGTSTAAVIWVLNTSANAVTLIPVLGDTIGGALSLSVGAGSAAMVVSDGVSKWLKA